MIYDPSNRPLIKKLLSARAIGLIKILPKIKNIMIQLMIDINASLLKISSELIISLESNDIALNDGIFFSKTNFGV